jgi:predicted nucleic acid-binding protein
VVPLPDEVQVEIVRQLAEAGVAGGAAYDASIAITAAHASATLLTRDTRAVATYRALQVAVEFVRE